MKILLIMTAALCLVACGKAPSESADGAGEAPEVTTQHTVGGVVDYVRQQTPFSEEQLRAVLDSDHRSEENRARDVYRNPLQTLQFFGLYPEARVVEINPGAGWYAEILAPLLQERGHYVAAVMDPEAPNSPPYAPRLAEMIQQKFEQDQDSFAKAHTQYYDPTAPVLGEPESADMVLTFRNVHSWIPADQAEGMFEAFYAVLKPGGTLGVVQHRAAPGDDSSETAHVGYVTEATVIMLAEDAGFRFVQRSDINANPRDTRSYPRGVWSLPPTLGMGDEDRERYIAIGESDRMTLRFIKD